MAMAAPLCFLCVFLCLAATCSAQSSFLYNGFNENARLNKNAQNLSLDGAVIEKPSGALRLTDTSHNVVGRAFYPNAFKMFDKSSDSYPNASSFSTSFVFAINPSSPGRGGYGFAFALVPSTQIVGAESGHYLGLFNASNDGNRSNHIFAVEFDTVNGHGEVKNTKGNDVGININSISSVASRHAYFSFHGVVQEIQIDSGDPIVAWIEYDGPKRLVNVTIGPFMEQKPEKPHISLLVDLTSVMKDQMSVGFTASTGEESSSHYILGWSFAVNAPALQLKYSELPNGPKEQHHFSLSNSQLRVVLPVLSIVTIVGVILIAFLVRRKWQTERLEDWERDCPHRFNYRDLYKATNGFKDTEQIGIGGFGSVYRGLLHSTGTEIAVKRVQRNSSQGLKEFAAEIESLGRLRHKNLVNLQGWCKKHNDLLIVYDYIPNGSLHSLLYRPKHKIVLNWQQRFNILKGIAAGLLYLHEDWEQVVIHRDVKPSNVLIDADMNARLSDFGLARQYDHNQISHTTRVVGTIGYIPPELFLTGKASKNADVFGYGVLILEVACGRKPLESDEFMLVDWVRKWYETGGILCAADPKLDSVYEVEEMEMVLQLGLFCTHRKPEARPTMRQVMRFLNRDDPLPALHTWDFSQSIFGSNLRLTDEVISVMSIGTFSSGSINTGR
ncbi:probable L-type lectin-domain containing receptor kinase VI.1 [Momordica charantia]|uniref:non-specific serine/threonine protein kinase n=1 Tax=Momordica charantia TaxID=3673 RepID=A0A6J1CLT8_MOMCH|nr:probable L-type lectin-domain containing receptor kinase VI.1 [Momordica charantia]